MSAFAERIERHLMLAVIVGGCSWMYDAADGRSIVYSGPVNINIPSTADGVYVNITTGAANSNASAVPGWDVNLWNNNSLDLYSPPSLGGGAYVGTGSTYSNLPSMTLISTASTFDNGGLITSDGTLNLNSSSNLIGFRFFNESAGTFHFGWMRVKLSGSQGAQPREIVDFAYESAGGILTPFGESEPVGIHAGDTGVPAPGTLVLLGLVGACGATRRRI